MVLKVHNVDGSTKMIAIHEGMNVRDVCILLAERNHKQVGPNWTLVEKLVDLHLGEGGREGGREGERAKIHVGKGSIVFEGKQENWKQKKRTCVHILSIPLSVTFLLFPL